MSIYDPLRDRLTSLDVTSVRMKFADIEDIIGRDLPLSARKYSAWWANNSQGGNRHSHAWMDIGWRAGDLALEMEEVSFVRDSVPTPPATFATGIKISLSADWTFAGKITLSQEGVLNFPQVVAEAGVYRFRFSGGDRHRCYIGESASLRRRFAAYRRPGATQATNLRLNELMIMHLSEGGRIEVDLITMISDLKKDGADKDVSLSDKAVRRLLEQAAIVNDGATEIDSLNR